MLNKNALTPKHSELSNINPSVNKSPPIDNNAVIPLHLSIALK